MLRKLIASTSTATASGAIGRSGRNAIFLPVCWLNFGPGKMNVIATGLRPVDKRLQIDAASVVPDAAFAESRDTK